MKRAKGETGPEYMQRASKAKQAKKREAEKDMTEKPTHKATEQRQ